MSRRIRPERRSARRRTILLGDALAQLRSLPARSVDVVVTSPPYFLLRNYDHAGQVGLERDVTDYVERLVAVCDEIGRVLKDGGSLWLNLSDSYSRAGRYGAIAKSLLLAPERVALALVERGWVLRNKVVWAKPNPMPSSVKDRLSCTWEQIFHFTRSRTYFYDLDAIRVPHRSGRRGLTPTARPAKSEVGQDSRPAKYDAATRPSWAGPLAGRNDGLAALRAAGLPGHPLGKNPGDVWTIPTGSFDGAHFATFPERLVARPLEATCPARTCSCCGRPWLQQQARPIRPSCDCPNRRWQRGVVLDPFMGSGTTALVAERLDRDWIGIELNAAYRRLALKRIATAARARTTGDARTQGASHAPTSTRDEQLAA